MGGRQSLQHSWSMPLNSTRLYGVFIAESGATHRCVVYAGARTGAVAVTLLITHCTIRRLVACRRSEGKNFTPDLSLMLLFIVLIQSS